MEASDGNALKTGLYRVWWMSGGFSVACVGMGHDGTRWLAPSNWLAPSKSPDWRDILKMEPLAESSPEFWIDHIETARGLLATVLEGIDGE